MHFGSLDFMGVVDSGKQEEDDDAKSVRTRADTRLPINQTWSEAETYSGDSHNRTPHRRGDDGTDYYWGVGRLLRNEE